MSCHTEEFEKKTFVAYLRDGQQERNCAEKKWASLLDVSLGKILNEIPIPLCGGLVVGPSSLSVVTAQSNKRVANRPWARKRPQNCRRLKPCKKEEKAISVHS